MKRILIVSLLPFSITRLLAQSQCLSGGCTNSISNYPVGTFSTTSSTWAYPDPAHNSMNAGNYTLFSVIAGYTYEWSYCESHGGVSIYWDAQMTLFNNNNPTTPICFSTDVCGTNNDAPYISWTPTVSGTVRILTTMYNGSGCQTNTGGPYNKMVWRRTGCPQPDPPTSVDNGGSFCQSPTATYFIGGNGSGYVNWHWYSGSCGGTPVGTGDHIDAPLTTPGCIDYYVRTENACGNSNCLGPVTVCVTASVTPSVTITPSGNTSICAGETVSFTAAPTNGGNNPTYKWYLNGTQVGTGSTYTTPPLTTNSTVYCVMTSNAQCTEPDDVVTSSTTNIMVNQPPTISISASHNPVTNGQASTLVASGASTYSWSNGLGSGSTVVVSPSSTTTYTVTGTSNGCSATASITINVTNPCTFTVSPLSVQVDSSGGNQAVTVTVISGTNCSWSANALGGCSWLTANGSGNGNGNFTITIDPNTTTVTRYCQVVVAGDTINITQTGKSSGGGSNPNCPPLNPALTMVRNGCDLAAPFYVNATYDWQWNGQPQQSGASRFFSVNSITGTGYYTCKVTIDTCIYFATDMYVVYNSANTPPCITGIEELSVQHLSVSPNPTSGSFTLSFETDKVETIQIKIYDAIGRVVYEQALGKIDGVFSKEINLKGVAYGTYTMQLKAGIAVINRQIQVRE